MHANVDLDSQNELINPHTYGTQSMSREVSGTLVLLVGLLFFNLLCILYSKGVLLTISFFAFESSF